MALTTKLVLNVWATSRPPDTPDETFDVWGEPTYDLVGTTRFTPLTHAGTTYAGLAVRQATFRVRRLPAIVFADDIYAMSIVHDGEDWALSEVLDLDDRFQRITISREPEFAPTRKGF